MGDLVLRFFVKQGTGLLAESRGPIMAVFYFRGLLNVLLLVTTEFSYNLP